MSPADRSNVASSGVAASPFEEPSKGDAPCPHDEDETVGRGPGEAGQQGGSRSRCGAGDRAWLWVTDTRTERAARAGAAICLVYLSVYLGDNQVNFWPLATILIHLTLSYFPVSTLGEALTPSTSCAWGIVIGAVLVSPMLLACTYGSVTLWAFAMAVVVMMEPVMNSKDPFVSALTFPFALVSIDNILLRDLDRCGARNIQENMVKVFDDWRLPSGSMRTYCLSAIVTVGCICGMMLLPPWRSTSRLTCRLVQRSLDSTAACMEELAELIEQALVNKPPPPPSFSPAAPPPPRGRPPHLPPRPQQQQQRQRVPTAAAEAPEAALGKQRGVYLGEEYQQEEKKEQEKQREEQATTEHKGLREKCFKQLAALRKMPPLMNQVNYEPTLWPLTARHASPAKWKAVLAQLRVVLYRIVDVTFIAEKHASRAGLGFVLCDPGQMQLLASEVRASARDIRRVAQAASRGGYYLIRCGGREEDEEEGKGGAAAAAAEEAKEAAEELGRRWGALTAALSAMVARKQGEQLRALGGVLEAGALGRLLSPTEHEEALRAYSSLAQLQQPRLAPAVSLPDLSSLRRTSWPSWFGPGGHRQSQHNVQEDLALVDRVMASYHNDATVSLCVRLVAPGHCVTPITEKVAAALKADGAKEGAVGVRRNLLNWVSIPLISVADGYREAAERYRHPLKWWSAKGRHTVRMLFGIGFLYALTMSSQGYRNFMTAGHFAGWQVHAFAITLQGNVEATIKKGLLRLGGALVGGAAAVLFACLFPPPYVIIMVMSLMEAAVCWMIPTPLVTRFQTSIDFDYFLQCFGVTAHLVMVSAFEPGDEDQIIRIGIARVCAQATGIAVAMVAALLIGPQSGYFEARRLTAEALRSGGRLLEPLAAAFFGPECAEGSWADGGLEGSSNAALGSEASRLRASMQHSASLQRLQGKDAAPVAPILGLTPSRLGHQQQHRRGGSVPVSESEVELVAEAPSDCPARRPTLQRLSAPHVVGGAASKISEEEVTSSGAMSHKVVSIDALGAGSEGDSRALIGEGPNDGIVRSPNGGWTSAAAPLPLEEAAVLVVDASAASESHQLNSGFAEWRWAIEEGEGSSAAAAQTSLKPSSSEAMIAPAELQKRLQECVNLMDRAYTALTLSDKYGQRWSRFIPVLGADPSCRGALGRAEELLAVLRNTIDAIAADASVIFGPYAIPHGSALSPGGSECFRSSAAAAMEFGQWGCARWRSLGHAFELVAYKVETRKHPLSCVPLSTVTDRGDPPHYWDLLRPQVTRMRHEQLRAYVLAWLGVSKEFSGQTDTAQIAGYSAPDVYRLHCVMLYISDLHALLLELLDDDTAS